MSEQWLSNTYLVHGGGSTFFVDAGGPVAPLVAKAEALGATPTHVLLTHRHHDHVAELGDLLTRWPDLQVLAHPDEEVMGVTGTMQPGEVLPGVQALHTPGHTSGMLALVVEDQCFTGDTLFKGSVGGVLAPGHTTYEDLRSSIMDTLMGLPKETVLRPGHTDPTTVGEEWETNRFIRLWRGLDAEGDETVTVWDREAILVLWGDDYDGGHKAWIRWADSGEDVIVPGSQVKRG